MRLASSGREYAKWTIVAPAPATLSASFDSGVTWLTMERPTVSEARILVAGPEAESNPAGTAVLKSGRNSVLIRVADSPELSVRDAGSITVFNV